MVTYAKKWWYTGRAGTAQAVEAHAVLLRAGTGLACRVVAHPPPCAGTCGVCGGHPRAGTDRGLYRMAHYHTLLRAGRWLHGHGG